MFVLLNLPETNLVSRIFSVGVYRDSLSSGVIGFELPFS